MKYWAILILAMGFWACQNVKQPEKPKDLIGKDKMVDVLTEAYLANAARSIDHKTLVDEGIKMDSLFYAKFGVDSLQFVQSNAFYAADVNTYIAIFEEVEARLNKMEKNLDSIRKAGIQFNDSIPAETSEKEEKKNPLGKRLPNLVIFHLPLQFLSASLPPM